MSLGVKGLIVSIYAHMTLCIVLNSSASGDFAFFLFCCSCSKEAIIFVFLLRNIL